jgi:hypothetical protein
MSFAINDWNLNPNRLWYIKIIDIGTKISVELYRTQEDA